MTAQRITVIKDFRLPHHPDTACGVVSACPARAQMLAVLLAIEANATFYIVVGAVGLLDTVAACCVATGTLRRFVRGMVQSPRTDVAETHRHAMQFLEAQRREDINTPSESTGVPLGE